MVQVAEQLLEKESHSPYVSFSQHSELKKAETIDLYIKTLHTELGIPDDYGRTRRMGIVGEVEELIPLPSQKGEVTGLFCSFDTVAAWEEMGLAALQDRVSLIPTAGFRSFEEQLELIQNELQTGLSLGEVLNKVAAPGYSEHHSGRAIDIDTKEFSFFKKPLHRTKAFRWLERYGADFGFELSYPEGNPHGFMFEAWHWRFAG